MDSFKELNTEETLESLSSALNCGESLYFAGAGCSQGLGFPSWGKLIEDLVEQLTKREIPYDGATNYLDLALKVKTFLEAKSELHQYHSYLHGRFRVPPPKSGLGKDEEWPESKLHALMFAFPIRSIVTTNYDHALEYYTRQLGRNIHVKKVLPDYEGSVGDFLFGLKDRRELQCVFHLHGDFEGAKSIILARDDYDRAYKQNREVDGKKVVGDSLYRKVLWALLTTRCLIFVGFSLTDDYLNEILKEVCAEVWGNFRERHFALFPYNPAKKDLLEAKKNFFLKEYSIQTVFYNDKNNHEELLDLLQWLQEKKESTTIKVEDPKPIPTATNPEVFEKMKKINKQAVPAHE
ncbi:MAG: SIR2 family protein [Bdellovibrionales bacterium]|nr:SIR2 family protein [Bdellovibrionales bacterium]